MISKMMQDEEQKGMPMDDAQEQPENEASAKDNKEDIAEGEDQANEPADPATERVVMAAMKTIYADQMFERVMKLLSTGQPGRALVGTTLIVMRALYEQSKGSMPPAALIEGAKAVVLLLAELALAAKIPLQPQDVQKAQGMVGQLLQNGLKPQGQMQGQMPGQPQPGLVAGAMQGA